jgi:hypothetical protein
VYADFYASVGSNHTSCRLHLKEENATSTESSFKCNKIITILPILTDQQDKMLNDKEASQEPTYFFLDSNIIPEAIGETHSHP